MDAPCAIQQPIKQDTLIDAPATAGLLKRSGRCQRDEVHAMTAQIVHVQRQQSEPSCLRCDLAARNPKPCTFCRAMSALEQI